MIHLAIGNALIGLLEGFLLVWLFRVPRAKAVGAMIAANYTSAWLGGLFIRGAIVAALPMTSTMVGSGSGHGRGDVWSDPSAGVAVCRLGISGYSRLAETERASVVLVQSCSYILLFGCYWMASGTSLYTKMHIVAPKDLSLPESVLVYFIAPSDGHVYRRDLTGGDEQRIYELHSIDDNDRLFVRPSAADTNQWDLMARLETADHRSPRFVLVLTNLRVEAAPDWRSTHNPPDYEGHGSTLGRCSALGVRQTVSGNFGRDSGRLRDFLPRERRQASECTSPTRLRLGLGPSAMLSIFRQTKCCSS
jgi:hypothetical protein